MDNPPIEEAVSAGAWQIGGGRISNTTLKPAILIDPPRQAKVSMHEMAPEHTYFQTATSSLRASATIIGVFRTIEAANIGPEDAPYRRQLPRACEEIDPRVANSRFLARTFQVC
jgi:hypothetical protein